MASIRVIDVHVGGQPVRVVVDGVPSAEGSTALGRAHWFAEHADEFRRALVLPPRGHDDLVAVALTDCAAPGAHAGLLFMDAAGYPPMHTAAAMAAALVSTGRGLLVTAAGADDRQVATFDTPAGPADLVVAPAEPSRRRPAQVRLRIGEAAVHTASAVVTRAGRQVRLDLAFAGAFLAIVDSEAAGVPLDRTHLAEARRAGLELLEALHARSALVDPRTGDAAPVEGVVFTGPPAREDAHLRGLVVTRHGVVDRSSVGGTAAVLAVLDAMGLAMEGVPFVHEGTTGLVSSGTITRRGVIGALPCVDVEVAAPAWFVGETTLLLAGDDPLRFGEGADRELLF